MARIVAVGNRSFAVALAGIGAEPVRCEDDTGFEEALRKTAVRKDVRLVFVPEPMMTAAPDAVRAFRARSKAALLGLPVRPSEDHPSLEEVRYLIEQATGARLI